LPSGVNEQLIFEDDKHMLYEVNLRRGEKFLFNKRKVLSIQMVKGLSQGLKYSDFNHRVEEVGSFQIGDVWYINGNCNLGILASTDIIYLETVLK
jgi:hypothetical protein